MGRRRLGFVEKEVKSQPEFGWDSLKLKGVPCIELESNLSVGPFKQFHDLLQPHLSFLRHIPMDAVQVVDHLGRIQPVPILFCSTWQVRFDFVQEFDYIINGYSKGRPGSCFIEQGDYELLHPQDSQTVSHSEFATVVKSGMPLDMGIIKRQRMIES
jgi:hypothetical protein